MKTNCKCGQPLHINESGKAVYCDNCDRSPKKNVLGGLLDAIKEKDKKDWGTTDRDIKLFIEERAREIDQNIEEATDLENYVFEVKYYCIRCERPTNKYGFCLWCEDELRETL